MKSTKKRMLLSVLSVALSVVMLIGTTFAWFTDSVTSGNNRIAAGNLDVELYHTNGTVTDESVDGATNLFEVEKWEPGVIAYENFTVANKGDLALKYSLAMNIIDFNYVKNSTYNLTQVLKVAIFNGAFSGNREDAMALNFDATLDQFAKRGELLAPTAAAASEEQFAVVIYWEPSNDDNNYNLNNGKETSDGEDCLFVDLGVNLVATQLSYESDSFDALYDANAISEVAKGKAVDLTKPIVLKSNNVEAVIPANALDASNEDDIIALSVENTENVEGSSTYEISLINETDDEEITETDEIVTVTVFIGKNLTDVKVAHSGVPMTKATTGADQTYKYDALTGILTIYTKSFSPFTVTYAVNELPAFTVENVDALSVVDFHKFGAVKPTSFEAVKNLPSTSKKLDSAKRFVADQAEIDNIENSPFKSYNDDYVISFSKDIDCDSIGIAGNYGDYNWIGFDIPTFITGVKDGKLAANTEVRLLKIAGIATTYEEVCNSVVDFTCGAADLSGENAGTTITVELRLYETEMVNSSLVETGAYIVADTFTYTF